MTLRDAVLVPNFIMARYFQREVRFENAMFFCVDRPVAIEGHRFKDVWIHQGCTDHPKFAECAGIIQHIRNVSAEPGQISYFD